MRTLLDLPNSTRPERRTALVARELAKYDIDIAALSETRLSGKNQRVEVGAGYTFFWKGKDEGVRRTGGVGFAIKSNLVEKIDHPNPITDRIISLRLSLAHNRFASVISVYAPTMDHDEESIQVFYNVLINVISHIPSADKIFLLGDFNAKTSLLRRIVQWKASSE